MVVVLPIAGTVLIIGYLESSISSSGISKLPFYFPGLGLLLAGFLIYLLGLVTTTLAGRWLWSRFERVLNKLPAIGKIYSSLKQILGYGEGDEALFKEVVLVKSSTGHGQELALVTQRFRDREGREQLTVFIPFAPNPTSGRLVILAPEHVEAINLSVHEALKSLVSIGQSEPLAKPGMTKPSPTPD